MSRRRLLAVHQALAACRSCSTVVGPAVHGPPVRTRVMLVGQAPGVHEAGIGRPFAWTAGRTLFRWFEQSVGFDEKAFREHVYFTAVARCFPGKAKGGGDRRPDRNEILACRPFLAEEVRSLRPKLVLAVGTLAITEVLGEQVAGQRLEQIIGKSFHTRWHDVAVDVIPLPHPSGASPWPKIEPGKTLLAIALERVRVHPAMQSFFRAAPTARAAHGPEFPRQRARHHLRLGARMRGEACTASTRPQVGGMIPTTPEENETTPPSSQPNPGDPGPEIMEPREPQFPGADADLPKPGAGPAQSAGDPRAWIP